MEQYRIMPQTRVDLDAFDPRYRGELQKDVGKQELKALGKTLEKLQELLYAEHRQKLLIILQGIDTSGKDSTIRHVFGDVNPQGTKVVGFKCRPVANWTMITFGGFIRMHPAGAKL